MISYGANKRTKIHSQIYANSLSRSVTQIPLSFLIEGVHSFFDTMIAYGVFRLPI